MRATAQLRDLLKGPGMVVAPGCVDPISARINEHAGFKAVYVTGSGMEAAILGHPDLGLKTLTETTVHAGRITDAVGIPVICDAEAGFGSYVNVVRTVREFEKAGVAAIHIEDQVTPPNSPGVKPRVLLSREEAVNKIKAAIDARTDPDFVIIARSDADEVSTDESIERCNLYLDAGADLAMPIMAKVDGKSRADLTSEQAVEAFRRIHREVRGDLLALNLPAELTTAEIEKLGCKVYIYATDSSQAAIAAMTELMEELRETGTMAGYFQRRPRIRGDVFRKLTRTDEWLEVEKRFGG